MTTVLFTFVVGFAQSVVTCESFDKTTGVTSGIYKVWDIKSDGGYIYIHYSQPQAIGNKTLTLRLLKKNSSSEYVPFDSKYFVIKSPSDKWTVYDFFFKQPGDYKIQVVENSRVLATTEITVNEIEGSSSSTNDEIDTYYYEESSVLVGQSIDDNFNVIGESTSFTLPSSKSLPLKIAVSHIDPLETDKVILEIYNSNNEFVDKLVMECKPEWNFIYTSYTFKKKDTYYIDAYTANDIFINTATIEIE